MGRYANKYIDLYAYVYVCIRFLVMKVPRSNNKAVTVSISSAQVLVSKYLHLKKPGFL